MGTTVSEEAKDLALTMTITFPTPCFSLLFFLNNVNVTITHHHHTHKLNNVNCNAERLVSTGPIKLRYRDWRDDGPVVKNTCTSRSPGFGSQHYHPSLKFQVIECQFLTSVVPGMHMVYRKEYKFKSINQSNKQSHTKKKYHHPNGLLLRL